MLASSDEGDVEEEKEGTADAENEEEEGENTNGEAGEAGVKVEEGIDSVAEKKTRAVVGRVPFEPLYE